MPAIRRLMMNPVVRVLPAGIFAATIAVGWLLRSLALRGLRAWTSRSQHRAGLILTDSLRGPTIIWVVILAVHLAVESSDLPPTAVDWSARFLLVLWILSLTMMFVRIAGKLVRYYGDQVPGALPVTTLTESLAQIAVVILGVL